MKRTTLALLVGSVSFCSPALAVVCTDPSGNALHIQEMIKDAAIWAEEKGVMLSGMAQDKALSIWEAAQAEYNASATISATTTAISSTANAAAEERYATSPTACEAVTRVKAFANSFQTVCDNPATEFVLENNQSQIVDCSENGGSGLNCGRVANQRKHITQSIVSAVNAKDGQSLIQMLDGGQVLGLSDLPMTPENMANHDIAYSLLLGVEEPNDIPRIANGELPSPNDKHGALAVSRWAERHVYRSVANAAIAEVKRLYDPTENGRASIMDQIEERVNYYNSEEFYKLLTNTNDKSNVPSNWDTLTPEQKHDWNLNAPSSEKMTSSEQVIRMIGEMTAFSLQLESMTLKSTLTSTGLDALNLKLNAR
ncbi:MULTISPECIES: hypothetical protein [Vibrio]|uniref:hypothetical protein n=1 Tax=Vibrio TaxID=662 RepID=UPI0020758181|nr:MULTISPECIES: hypothetical protein [Vibrio]USD35485.1 hypothetical protein J8Z27_22970 [Vibrio sp. SCSIO 43186]USD72609.1 hypothetical protein J4N41_22975 [Vibrio sp. SCSIO 43139]USD99000.1 hypothetical protein CTT30_23285 [Vibrio coralliilyticus]